MNRGNGRQRIFRADGDYERFLGQLQRALEMDAVILYAYCLMPTHFHLFVETPGANLDAFMRRLETSYAMYFRYKRQLPGHCFQGRYKAPLVEGDDYALRLTRYIHLNPAKNRFARTLSDQERWEILEGHRWSSLGGYLSARNVEPFVDYRWLEMMGPKRSRRLIYRGYVREMLSDDDPVITEAMESSSYAIGDEAFRREVAEWVRGTAAELRSPRDVVVPAEVRVPIDAVAREVAREFAVCAEDLAVPRKRVGLARGAFAELACRLSGVSQRALARHLGGISEQAVGRARRKLQQALRDDPALRVPLRNVSARLRKR
jgi:REP element-mobilizing transposase RayT